MPSENTASWALTVLQHAKTSTPPPKKSTYHFALFYGNSQYGALNFFMDELSQELTRQGHRCTPLNLNVADTMFEILSHHLSLHPDTDGLMVMNGMVPNDALTGNPTVWDRLQLPILSFFVDHPLKINRRLRKHTPYQLNFFLDEAWLPFVATHYPQTQQGFNAYLGLGAPAWLETNLPRFEEKQPRILFTGSYVPTTHSWAEMEKLPTPLQRVCHTAIEAQLADLTQDYAQTLIRHLEARGFAFQHMTDDTLRHLFIHSERWLIALFREQYLRLMKDLPLTLAGGGWLEHYPSEAFGSQWQVLPPQPLKDVCKLIQQHQFVLNPSPMFPTAVHDRLYYTTRSRSVFVSEQNPFHEALLGSEAYVGLPYHTPEAGFERVAHLLTHPAEANTLAEAGYAKTMPHLGVEQVAKGMVDAFENWMAKLWLLQ